MYPPKTNAQIIALTQSEREMLGLLDPNTKEVVPAQLAQSLEEDAEDQAKWAKHYSDRCDKLAEQLAECVGVLASVDTERRFRDMHGNRWISQTLDWCKGAKAIGEKANALLEEHDDLSAQNNQVQGRPATNSIKQPD